MCIHKYTHTHKYTFKALKMVLPQIGNHTISVAPFKGVMVFSYFKSTVIEKCMQQVIFDKSFLNSRPPQFIAKYMDLEKIEKPETKINYVRRLKKYS